VRGRGDRDQLGGRVDAGRAGGRHDGREALLEELAAEVPGVQIHVVVAGLPQHPVDRLGDDVARRQLGELVLSGHEPRSGLVHQVRTLAAQRLGDQRALHRGDAGGDERGRVELDELHIGDDRAGPQCQGHAVAGGDRGIGRRGVHLAHAAGGQHHRAGQDRADAVLGALAENVQGETARATVGRAQQIQHQGVLDPADPRVPPDRLVQCALHLGTGSVAARVHDPVGAVATLAGQHQRAVRVAVEHGAQAHQLPHPGRALLDQHPHGGRIAQADARDLGVEGVRLRSVQRVEHRGDAALRPPRGPVVDVDLGDHRDVQARLAQMQRRGQPGDAGTDHQDVGGLGPPRLGGGEPAGQRRKIRGMRHAPSQPRRRCEIETGSAGVLRATCTARAGRRRPCPSATWPGWIRPATDSSARRGRRVPRRPRRRASR
jgi:hypothetical protein